MKSLLAEVIEMTHDACGEICRHGETCPIWEYPMYCPVDGHILPHAWKAKWLAASEGLPQSKDSQDDGEING